MKSDLCKSPLSKNPIGISVYPLGSYWILRILLDIPIDFNGISLCPIGFYLILRILLDILIDFNGVLTFPVGSFIDLYHIGHCDF